MSKAVDACTTRRSLVTLTLALAAVPYAGAVIAANAIDLGDPIRTDEHEDAELLAFEAPIVALAAIADAMLPEIRRIDDACMAAAEPRPEYQSAEWPAYVARHDAAEKALGLVTAQNAWQAADNELLRAIRAIEHIPARTFDGLRMKARVVEHGDVDLVQSIVDDLVAIDRAMTA